jgi:hypothetical protein
MDETLDQHVDVCKRGARDDRVGSGVERGAHVAGRCDASLTNREAPA